LGVNGAGKTTTFKGLTAEVKPTDGHVMVKGLDITRDFNKIRKLVGYCPQYDAIFELMSVEEHLKYYSKIKCIPYEKRQFLIDEKI
jgi:ABC-type multidrug transport system ATPase subunit